jgi:uncharacterized damage-inducible protein DinB
MAEVNALAEMRDAAVEILLKGESMLSSLSASDYSAQSSGAFGSPIGAHFRHVLDHFQNLLESYSSGLVDYDARRRDPLLESDPAAALAKSCDFRQLLDRLDPAETRPLDVLCKVSYSDSTPVRVPSNFARELMFCVAHAIHHHAMIGMQCAQRGIEFPDQLGVAPSTVIHRAQTSTASGK